jgi:hypothetical protein
LRILGVYGYVRGVMGDLGGVAGGLRGFSATLGVQTAYGVWVTSRMPTVGCRGVTGVLGGWQVALGSGVIS